MSLSYQEFELAVDRHLSQGSQRNALSVYDLPQRELLAAYHEGMAPEAFTLAYKEAQSVSADSPVKQVAEQTTFFWKVFVPWWN